MKIYQLNLKNNNLSFKSRKKKSASFDGPNTRRKSTDSQLKIELPISRSDYLIMSNGDLKCNHHREGKQIGNSDFFETISVTPIDSNDDIYYNPSCDYSCYDENLNKSNFKLKKEETEAYANSLSKQILNYACENNDLFSDINSQNYFYSLIENDFNILNNHSKDIISNYMALESEDRKKQYDFYCEQLAQSIINKNNLVFFRYCQKQKKLAMAKTNGQIYDNEEIILKKLSEHKDEINYLWTEIFTMTSMFKGIFMNFFDLSELPCPCCGKPLKNDNLSVEHIRPHSTGRKLMKNVDKEDKFQIINQKFNSPRNFIFEHQICNGNRGNMDFITFLNNIDENFGQNIINNINGIIELEQKDKNLSKALKSYNKFVQYCLKDILFYYKNKPKLLKLLINNLTKFDANEAINKEAVLKELNNIIKKQGFSNHRVINSIKKDIDKIFNSPDVTSLHCRKMLESQMNIEKKESSNCTVKQISKLVKSKKIDNISTKKEIDNLLNKTLNLMNPEHPALIKEIKYLYNHYCVLKYYPPVISKTIYRETGGKVNIGLSSWANLMYEIENKDRPKRTFYEKYIKPIGNYIASLFSLTRPRVSNLPRI